jgi:hypothetical protein
MVLVLHRILGRVRFKVLGLRGSGPFAAYLENRLRAQPGIRRVSASATTGNVLVLFAATHTVEALATLIQDFTFLDEGLKCNNERLLRPDVQRLGRESFPRPFRPVHPYG